MKKGIHIRRNRRRLLGRAGLLAVLIFGAGAGILTVKTAGAKLTGERVWEAGSQGVAWLLGQVWPAGIGGEPETAGFWDREPDPSYRHYQQTRDFFQARPYLAWYMEESGQEREEQAQAGQASGQSYAGLDQDVVLPGHLDLPVIGTTYVMAQLADYDFLMKNFYNIHTSTTAPRDLISAESLLEPDLALETTGEGPQILIYHTHSQEAFADSGPGETIVAVGEELARILEEKGYEVYHDASVYDLVDGRLDRSKAYTYACENVTRILEENPSIQVVLDLHRDGVAENLRLTTKVNGNDTAQIMFFNGMCRTPDGPVDYLPNPYLKENLAFSFQMQLGAQAYYPGFARKIYLKGLRYNLHLRPRSALVEVGAQTNTFAEACGAMEPLAELLDMVLQGK